MEIAVTQDVQSGALLVANHHGQGILKFFPEPHVQHAGIEWLAPHTHVEPAWSWKRSGGRAGQYQVFGGNEHELPPAGIVQPRQFCAIQIEVSNEAIPGSGFAVGAQVRVRSAREDLQDT
jgi:hypothetical protein